MTRASNAPAPFAIPSYVTPVFDTPLVAVPANEASWRDLQAIFGVRGYTAVCQCQWFRARDRPWNEIPREELAARLRLQTGCGDPQSKTTSGLVGYVDGEPVGWVAVGPRTAFPRLPIRRVALKARGEDPDDSTVWSVVCFATRAGYRRRGVMRALVQPAIEFARERGARALEAYPMITEPGKEITWGEVHVGTRSIFEDAGFTEVANPTPRRVVMRIDLQ